MAWLRQRRSPDGRIRYQGSYRDPSGRERSAGTFSTARQALRAATKAEAAIEAGTWFDVSAGKVTFRAYAREVWWPSLHLEPTTKAAYKSNLETHFLPFFGDLRMANILPSHVQVWVNQALEWLCQPELAPGGRLDLAPGSGSRGGLVASSEHVRQNAWGD